MKRSVVILLCCLLLTGIILLAVKSDKERVLTVGVISDSYWGVPTGNPHELLEQAIAQFEKKHPGVRVEYTSGIQKADYPEWLAEKLLAGEEPDLFLVFADDLYAYADMGALLDLTQFLKTDQEMDLDNYYGAAIHSGQQKGHHYALPVESVPTLMFVNKTLLASHGIMLPVNSWNWDDFYRICQQVSGDSNGDGRPDSYGCYDYTWQQAALNNNAALFKGQGQGGRFEDVNLTDAIQFMIKLQNLNGGYTVTAKDFDLGQVAFRPFSYAEYRTYQPYPWRIKKYSAFDWDVLTFPAGPNGTNVSPSSTLLMGISARTRHPELAWAFLKTISYDKEVQLHILDKTQALPARRDVMQTEEARQLFQQTMGDEHHHLTLGAIDAIMNQSVAEVNFRKRREIMEQANITIQKIITGGAGMTDTLRQLQREINEALY